MDGCTFYTANGPELKYFIRASPVEPAPPPFDYFLAGDSFSLLFDFLLASNTCDPWFDRLLKCERSPEALGLVCYYFYPSPLGPISCSRAALSLDCYICFNLLVSLI